MDARTRETVAKQGLGFILHSIRCSICQYIACGFSEEDTLERGAPCPKCGQRGDAGELVANYFAVANWVGEYSVSANRRDHAAAVILFCAWVESLLEALKETRVSTSSVLKQQYAGRSLSKVKFKEVFPGAPSALLDKAPEALRGFWPRFTALRKRRDLLLHGTSEYTLSERHAHEAFDLATLAISAYVWLNNEYCVKT